MKQNIHGRALLAVDTGVLVLHSSTFGPAAVQVSHLQSMED